MGIQGLIPFLNKVAPEAIQFVSLESMASKRLAVDMTIYLCRLFYANESIDTPAKLGAAYVEQFSLLAQQGLQMVHVFDGPVDSLKHYAHEKRAKDRAQSKKQLETMRSLVPEIKEKAAAAVAHLDKRFKPDEDLEATLKTMDETVFCFKLSQEGRQDVDKFKALTGQIDKMSKRMERGMSRSFLEEARLEAERLGLFVVVAKTEAEEECCHMAIRGEVDCVATEDVDALAFGAPYVLRGITTLTPTLICLETVLGLLGLDFGRFIDLCLLSGSDFTPKARGFGPATSYKLLKNESLGVDKLIEAKHRAFAKWSEEESLEFLAAYSLARDKFLWGR